MSSDPCRTKSPHVGIPHRRDLPGGRTASSSSIRGLLHKTAPMPPPPWVLAGGVSQQAGSQQPPRQPRLPPLRRIMNGTTDGPARSCNLLGRGFFVLDADGAEYFSPLGWLPLCNRGGLVWSLTPASLWASRASLARLLPRVGDLKQTFASDNRREVWGFAVPKLRRPLMHKNGACIREILARKLFGGRNRAHWFFPDHYLRFPMQLPPPGGYPPPQNTPPPRERVPPGRVWIQAGRVAKGKKSSTPNGRVQIWIMICA